MKTLNYKIKFLSPWHCGSGLAAGADVDLLVIKDRHRLPYIPGKTIKGLVREWAEAINSLHSLSTEEVFNDSFGVEAQSQGCLFFTNAELPKDICAAIVKDCAQDYMYMSISSTKIKEDGIAEEHSLRKIEAAIPCELEGFISGIPDEMYELLSLSLQAVKHIGVNRNRGLGRCDIILKEGGKA